MAKSIEEFAGPLLARSKQQTKDIQRTVRNQNLALLGVSVANAALRTRAMNRAEEWYKGAEPILRQAKQNASDGFSFWASHDDMLKDHDASDWRTARAQQLFNTHLAESGSALTGQPRASAFAAYTPQIQDELDAYGKLMDVHAEFKGGTDATERERLSTNYYGNIQSMIDTQRSRIEGDNTIVSSLMNSLGIHSRDRMSPADERTLEGFLSNSIIRRDEALGLTGQADRPEVDINLSEFRTVSMPSQEEVYGRNQGKYQDYIVHLSAGDFGPIDEDLKVYGLPSVKLTGTGRPDETYELTFAEALEAIEVPEEGRNTQQLFIHDTLRLASVLSWQHEQGAKEEARQAGLTVPLKMPEPQEFVNMSFQTLVDSNRFTRVERAGWGFSPVSKPSLSYNPLSEQDFSLLANNITSIISEEDMAKVNMNPHYFSTGDQSILQQENIDREDYTQRNIAQARSFSAEETPYNELVENIVTAQESPSYNSEEAQALVDFYIADNPELSSDQTQELRNIVMPPTEPMVIEENTAPVVEENTRTWGLSNEQKELFSRAWNDEILPSWERVKEAVREYDFPISITREEGTSTFPSTQDLETLRPTPSPNIVNPLNEKIRDSVLSFWDRLPRFKVEHGPNERTVKLERFVVGIANAAVGYDRWDIPDSEWESLESKARERDQQLTDEELLVEEENLRRREVVSKQQREAATRAIRNLRQRQVPSLLQGGGPYGSDFQAEHLHRKDIEEYREKGEEGFRRAWNGLLDAPWTPNSNTTLRDILSKIPRNESVLDNEV